MSSSSSSSTPTSSSLPNTTTKTSSSSSSSSSSTTTKMRIACLLPSATDICIALGLADFIVGVTHECNMDELRKHKSNNNNNNNSNNTVYILTECGLDPSLTNTQAEIDAQVKEAVAGESCSASSKDINSIYPILEHEFQKANPTIVFTQNLCAVCAPSVQDVENLLLLHNTNDDNNDGNGNGNKVQILSLDPHTLEDVAQTFVNIATLCNVPERGQIMKDAFLTKLNLVQKAVDDHTISTNSSSVSNGSVSSVSSSNGSSSMKKKRVLLLEWLDPPYDAGHWIPNMIENAGCIPIKIKIETNKHIPKDKSKVISWDDIYNSNPDVVIIACCGFDLKRNLQDAIQASSQLDKLRTGMSKSNDVRTKCRIYACNGDMHFTRPGPTLLEGVCTIARCVYDDNEKVLKSLKDLNFFDESNLQWGEVPLSTSSSTSTSTSKDHLSSTSTSTSTSVLSEDHSSAILDIEDMVTDDYTTVHDEACSAGKMAYTDPKSGYKVFTELAHKKRGKCCGSGCRHCPYNHENVKDKDKASKIVQPAFLYEGRGGEYDISRTNTRTRTHTRSRTRSSTNTSSTTHSVDIVKGRDVKILFFSGGKDSFLTIRAILKSYQQKQKQDKNIGLLLILLTTFDSTSRVIALQEMHIETVLKQATHLQIPLVGVPVIRGSAEGYVPRINRAINLIADRLGGKHHITSLCFGDLHLEHIRSWREKEVGSLGYDMQFPVWKTDYKDLTNDLEESGIEVQISASTISQVRVGEQYNRAFMEKLRGFGNIDLFGEKGEFHSVAKVWTVTREKALGIQTKI